MRANWDQAEALMLSANEHQQKLEEQQQQHHQPELAQHHTIVEASTEHRHPLQSATTPAWGTMADAIAVKDEPHFDDKNNDSGISPGHYMSETASPNSRRSSTVNCSLSPVSTSSQDSHNLPMTNGYEYSPPSVFKPCDSPPEFAANGQPTVAATPMEENSMNADESQHALSNGVASPGSVAIKAEPAEHIECSPDPLQCPVCTFSTQSRLQFSEHLKSHCSTSEKFDENEFTKSVMEQLTNGGSIGSPEDLNRASPTQNERTSDQEAEEPGVRVPRVNSQGKVKTFRCKHCDFLAITKVDFWEHTRSHIKIEKLLTCPKCPFVTELKHHLEYHLRNHVGSKPYKCDKCPYSCVNKSMLNSHLKSHSNVYQFRCADCAYATKYCHSLKLHLRKYKHNPAMVLNADGSPNPLPIIDVYGTRRGPKAKPKKDPDHHQQQQQQQQLAQQQPQSPQQPQQSTSFMPNVVPQQSPMQQLPFQFNPLNGINGLPKLNGFNGFNGAAPAGGLGLSATPNLMGFSYNPLFAGFPLANPFALGAGAIPEPQDHQHIELLRANLIEAAKTFANEARITELSPSDPEYATEVPMPEAEPMEHKFDPKQEPQAAAPVAMPPAPLDLSKSEVEAEAAVAAASSSPARCAPAPSGQGTSRRKGRAVKLDKRVMQNDSDEEMRDEQQQQQQQQPHNLAVFPPSVSPASSTDSKESKESKESTSSAHFAPGMSSEFTCHFCDISFGNEIMHSVHMGYHGYQNPFTCNMCGMQCADKVSFFLHIARSKH